MKYTYIKVEDWCSLWRGDELIAETHSLTIQDLADFAEQDGEIELVAISGYDTACDHEVTELQGFKGVTLDKWLSLAKEPA